MIIAVAANLTKLMFGELRGANAFSRCCLSTLPCKEGKTRSSGWLGNSGNLSLRSARLHPVEVSLHRRGEQTRKEVCLPRWRTKMHPCKRDPTCRSLDRSVAVVARVLRHRVAC